MKKKNSYLLPDQPNNQVLHEPDVSYLKGKSLGEAELYPVMSQKELDGNCLTLAESKRLIMEKIHKHFHS